MTAMEVTKERRRAVQNEAESLADIDLDCWTIISNL